MLIVSRNPGQAVRIGERFELRLQSLGAGFAVFTHTARVRPLVLMIGERHEIDDDVSIVVNRITGSRLSLGIVAPRRIRIVRAELAPTVSDGVRVWGKANA